MKVEYYLENGTAELHGRVGNHKCQVEKIQVLTTSKGVVTVFIIDPPLGNDCNGRRKVISRESDYVLPITQAEGGILCKENQALVIPSQDSPVLILENLVNGHIGAVRAGRESLINRHSECCIEIGVVERLISALEIRDGKQTQAHIIGGICNKHFGHRNSEFVRPFVRLYGPEVVTDDKGLNLDLEAVITAKLHRYGIVNIFSDSLCSYEHPGTASLRAGRSGLNWTIVIKSR